MKHNYLLIIAVLAFGFITSCKKDPKPDLDPELDKTIVDDRPPAKVVEALTTELAKIEDISNFVDALKAVSLTQEEVSKGLTVFAPVNAHKSAPQAMASRLSKGMMLASASQKPLSNKLSVAETSGSIGLTDKELKDHIVKGVYKLADIENGAVLITLSGKSLKFTKDGDQIWINGVKINEGTTSSDGKQTIFVVGKSLSHTEVTDEPVALGSIEVTVWDATEWSTEDTIGKIAPKAYVAIYRSHEDYSNNKPLFEGESDNLGKVKFDKVESGTYYIAVTKGDMSNIFYKSKNPGEEIYSGMVAAEIFQSAAAVDAAPEQSGQPGNFRWLDLNGDGVINQNDRTALPSESVEIEEGNTVQIAILIGYVDNNNMGPLKRESQVLAAIESAESSIINWQNAMKMLDGVLSDDAAAPMQIIAYLELDNFNFSTPNIIITQRWNEAYTSISSLNKLIRDIPNVSMANMDQKIAQARALRAAVYLQLMTYYGNVPIQRDVVMEAGVNSSNREEVYAYIKQELTDIQKNVPNASSQDQLNSLFVSALLSKAALVNKDYTTAALHASEVINSGKYALEKTTSIFTPTSKETIWGKNSILSSEFKTYFFNRTFSPIIRLSEIYLIAAEASIQTGNVQKAVSYLNPVLQTDSLPGLSGTESIGTLTNSLRNGWKITMPREGARFANLVRWEMTSEVLGSKGFSAPKHNLLPIPQVIIDRYSGIIQNPGY